MIFRIKVLYIFCLLNIAALQTYSIGAWANNSARKTASTPVFFSLSIIKQFSVSFHFQTQYFRLYAQCSLKHELRFDMTKKYTQLFNLPQFQFTMVTRSSNMLLNYAKYCSKQKKNKKKIVGFSTKNERAYRQPSERKCVLKNVDVNYTWTRKEAKLPIKSFDLHTEWKLKKHQIDAIKFTSIQDKQAWVVRTFFSLFAVSNQKLLHSDKECGKSQLCCNARARPRVVTRT